MRQRTSLDDAELRPGLGLPRWIVRRIAYAVDVPMAEASSLIGELAALPRKRQGDPLRNVSPTSRTLLGGPARESVAERGG